MRKYRFWIFPVLLIIMLPLHALAADVIGKITRLKGTAFIYREAVPKPVKISIDMPIHLGDRIKTEVDSKLRIELKDGSILTMAQNADLHLKDFQFSRAGKRA